MRMMKSGLITLVMALGIGCAAIQAPPEDVLTRVPVIEVGQAEPADKQYVLHVRAGQPVPLRFTMRGPLFLQPTEGAAQVQFAHSLYIYKEWSSLDGFNWTRRGFEGAVSFGLAPKGGIVDIHVGRTD
jgi:hypothetical protein